MEYYQAVDCLFDVKFPSISLAVPALCPECEGKPPTRRCHECADYLCDECFVTIHRKGARQSHLWTPIRHGLVILLLE